MSADGIFGGVGSYAWQCTGTTSAGHRCERRTTDASGLCGQCSGAPPPPPATAAAAAAGPGPDPLDPRAEHRLTRIAQDRHAPDSELIRVAEQTASPATRSWVADNEAAPAEALARIVADSPGDDDTSVDIRAGVAAHRNASPATLDTLAGDPSLKVRLRVASHRSTPPGALSRLAADPVAAIPVTIAKRLDCPPEILTVLASDPREGVRKAAEKHPDLPAAGRAAAGLLSD